MKLISTVLFFLLLMPALVFAATTGRIKGKVTDLKTGEALIGANVIVVGTSLGAATDINGAFVINNLDANTYQLKVTYVGYQTVSVSNVRVYADLTTEQNFQLPAEGIEVGTIEIIAERPLVNKSNTNANRITTSDDIESLPVRGIDNILNLTAGVNVQDNAVFIRGGRQDEVGFYLEGANITDPVLGGRAVTISQDAVEEIQVQSGGYTAEFGNANSGIVRQQIKSGTPDLHLTGEYITDNVGFAGKDSRYNGEKRVGAYWFGYNEAIGTISGPVVDPRFKFFGLFNYKYQRDQNPQPYPGINLGRVGDVTTGDTVNLVYPAGALYKNSLEEYTGTASLTLDFNPLIFRMIGTYTTGTTFNPYSSARVSGNIANMFDLSRTEQVDQTDGSFSLKATHMLSGSTFYEVTAGYSFSTSKTFDPYLEDNFLQYGDSAANAAAGFIWPGATTRPTRYNIMGFAFNAPGDLIAGYGKNKRENLNFNASLNTTVGNAHSLKIGGEVQTYTIRNFSFGNESVMGLAGLIKNNNALPDGDPNKRSVEEIIIGRGVNNYGYDVLGNETSGDGFFGPKKPLFAGAYVQDKIEWNDLILNLGLRFDYIDVDNKEMIDPARPEKSISKSTGDIIEGGWADVPSFSSISPRLGFSFPVTDVTVFHAQYGKFVQQTRLRDIYQGLYATAQNLVGGLEITAPVGFNVRPTRTTQYELGFTQQIGDFASFDITGYYKDIQDQVVFDKQATASSSPFKSYNILTNGDFATTKGIEVSFNMRRQSRFQINGSVTFQDAEGTGSYPNSARGIVGAPLDGVTIFKPQYISPLEYNNSFKGNFNLDYRFGKNDGPKWLEQFGISALFTFASGHPFTQGIGGEDLEGDARDRQPIEPLNSSTTPWIFQVDLRVDKTFNIIDKLNANIYLYVINLFDTKNIENVFLRTGSTDDDGYISDPQSGGKLVEANGQIYAQMYRAINIDYYEQWQAATTGAPYTTDPSFFGPPRQVRLGLRLEY